MERTWFIGVIPPAIKHGHIRPGHLACCGSGDAPFRKITVAGNAGASSYRLVWSEIRSVVYSFVKHGMSERRPKTK